MAELMQPVQSFEADPLIGNTEQEEGFSPDTMASTPVSPAIANARQISVKLAKLDEELGKDYEEAYTDYYTRLSGLPEKLQNEEAEFEFRSKSSRVFAKRLADLPIEVESPTPVTTSDGQAIGASVDEKIKNLYLRTKSTMAAALPLEENTLQYSFPEGVNPNEQAGLDFLYQQQSEAVARYLDEIGLIRDDTVDISQWEYKSDGQYWLEFAASVVPFRGVPSGASLANKIDNYHSMSISDQLKYLPTMMLEIKEQLGNNADLALSATQYLLMGNKTYKEGLFIDTAFGLAEIPTIKGVKSFISQVRRGTNAVAGAVNRGLKKDGARLAGQSMVDPTAVSRTGMSADEARFAGDPFISSQIPTHDYDGLAPDLIEDLENRRLKFQGQVNQIIKDHGDISPLTVEEQEQFIRLRMAEIPRSAKIIERDSRGFTVELVGGTKTNRITFTRDGLGQVTGVEPTTSFGRFFLSAAARLTGKARETLNFASLVENKSAAVTSVLGEQLDMLFQNRFRDKVMPGLSNDEWLGVQDVLMQGNRVTKSFSAKELLSGVYVEGKGVVKLTDKQAVKYFETRQLYDDLHSLADQQLVRELEFDGYSQINAYVDGQAVRIAGRWNKQAPAGIKRVATIGNRRKLTGKTLTKDMVSDERRIFVELHSPVKIGDEEFAHAWVRPEDMKDFMPGYLRYRQGYVPNYYTNINYAIRQRITRIVDGVPTKGWAVRRFFDTKDEANKFLEEANETIGDAEQKLELISDREIRGLQTAEGDEYRKLVENEARYTGQYIRARNDEPIKYGYAGEETPQLGAFDALNRYAKAVGHTYPQTAFRQRAIVEFQNTYGKFLADPKDWRSDLKPTAELTVNQRNAIQRYREDLMDWMSIRDEKETMTANLIRSVTERMENKLSPATRESLKNMAQNDVTAYVRGITHHMMLGMGNIAQLIVQGMGVFIAASVDPKNFAKAMPRFAFLRAVAYMHPSDKMYKSAIAMLAKTTNVPIEEADELANLLHKSGLPRALRNTSADYNAVQDGMAVTSGMFARAVDKSAVAYREGELFNRIVSFTIGYLRAKELKAAGKGSKDLLSDTMSQFYKVSFNMQRTNRATWQKGWLGVATQYQQITAKYLEHLVPAMLGKEGAQWTASEAYRSLFLSTALFGAEGGIPFGKFFSGDIRNWVMGSEENGGLGITDERAVVAIEGGIIDMTMGHLLALGDGYASVSSRGGIASGVADLYERLADNPSMAEMMTGALGSLAFRSWTGVSRAIDLISPYTMTDEEMNWEVLTLAADELGRATSSWDSYYKARLWSQNAAIVDSKGRKVSPLGEDGEEVVDGISDGRAFARLIGFQPKDVAYARNLQVTVEKQQEGLRKAVESVRYLQARLASSGNLKDMELYKVQLKAIHESLPPGDQAAFRKRVAGLLKEDDQVTRNINKLIERESSLGESIGELEGNPLVDLTSNNQE